MISAPLVKFVLTAAMRDRLVLTMLLMIALATGMSVFLGASSVTEQESFALVFGAGGLRFLGVIGVVLFCCFYMRRSFETKEVEFLLSRPVSRITFLLSHTLAFMVLAAGVAVLTCLAVSVLGRPNAGGLMVWGLSIGVENILMAATAMFFSIVLSSAAGAALAALGFYVLCRLIGMLLGIAALPAENMVFAVLNNVMDMISIIVPRLDLMGQTSWLVYGVEGAGGILLTERAGVYAHWLLATLGPAGFVAGQGVVFLLLLLAATMYDFSRRQF